MGEYGLVAFGRSGDWELTVDEVLGGRQYWCLQIESPLVCIQCGVESLTALAGLQRLLETSGNESSAPVDSIKIGLYYEHPVLVRLDNEFSDRCFIIIGDSGEARFEVILAGKDFIDFRDAVSQVVDELDLNE